MSTFSSDINTNMLFDELQTAIEDDKRYWIQNDAKIKACVTSKSYDEFREYVAAAHLTPLSKTDKEKKYRTWNSIAGKSSNPE